MSEPNLANEAAAEELSPIGWQLPAAAIAFVAWLGFLAWLAFGR